MKKKIYVYISGPMTSSGNYLQNIVNGIDAKHALWEMGFIPFCPFDGELSNLRRMWSWKDSIEYDLAWIDKCDAVLRLPGKSTGGDIETVYAKKQGIPVMKSLGELLRRFGMQRGR